MQEIEKMYEGRKDLISYEEYMKQMKMSNINFGFPNEW